MMRHHSTFAPLHSIIVAFFLFLAAPLAAQTMAEADSAYVAEDYQRAAEIYTALLEQNGESATIYYNLGNAYYRMDSLGRAILNYERALLLDPSDADTRFNLQLARSHTADKVTARSEFFFVTWWHTLTLSLNVQTWAYLALAAFLAMLLCIGLYIFLPSVQGRKITFTLALVMLAVCALANISAYQARTRLLQRDAAIVMRPSAVVHSNPSDSGKDLFILHEGTHVDILDSSMSDWLQIRINDDKEGWIRRDEIEVI